MMILQCPSWLTDLSGITDVGLVVQKTAMMGQAPRSPLGPGRYTRSEPISLPLTNHFTQQRHHPKSGIQRPVGSASLVIGRR